jgi:hypothetical protein
MEASPEEFPISRLMLDVLRLYHGSPLNTATKLEQNHGQIRRVEVYLQI